MGAASRHLRQAPYTPRESAALHISALSYSTASRDASDERVKSEVGRRAMEALGKIERLTDDLSLHRTIANLWHSEASLRVLDDTLKAITDAALVSPSSDADGSQAPDDRQQHWERLPLALRAARNTIARQARDELAVNVPDPSRWWHRVSSEAARRHARGRVRRAGSRALRRTAAAPEGETRRGCRRLHRVASAELAAEGLGDEGRGRAILLDGPRPHTLPQPNGQADRDAHEPIAGRGRLSRGVASLDADHTLQAVLVDPGVAGRAADNQPLRELVTFPSTSRVRPSSSSRVGRLRVLMCER